MRIWIALYLRKDKNACPGFAMLAKTGLGLLASVWPFAQGVSELIQRWQYHQGQQGG